MNAYMYMRIICTRLYVCIQGEWFLWSVFNSHACTYVYAYVHMRIHDIAPGRQLRMSTKNGAETHGRELHSLFDSVESMYIRNAMFTYY